MSEVFLHSKTILHVTILSLSSSLLTAKKMEMEITFKAIRSSRVWNHAVLERLNFGSNFNNPYVVAIYGRCVKSTQYTTSFAL